MKKAKSFFFWGTVCCCLFCFLQIWYPFYFYYVEQLQVFPLTWACFEETCRQPGGLGMDQARRLKELESENARLKRAVADLTLDNLILKEVSTGKF
jgi:hypothetical protein